MTSSQVPVLRRPLKTFSDRRREIQARADFRRFIDDNASLVLDEAGYEAEGVDGATTGLPGGTAASAPTSCFTGFIVAIGRALRKVGHSRRERSKAGKIFSVESVKSGLRHVQATSSRVLSTSSASLGQATRVGGVAAVSAVSGTSLFGKRREPSKGSDKLEKAATALEERISGLEKKIQAARAEARALASQGSKAAALRVLRKSKVNEAQVVKLQAASVAVDRQLSLLEDVDLQTTIAAALNNVGKDVKRAKKALSGVDQAIDDATEAKEMIEDVHSALGNLAQNTFDDLSLDDDELLLELNQMIDPDYPANTTNPAEVATSAEQVRVWPSAPVSYPSVPQANEVAQGGSQEGQ